MALRVLLTISLVLYVGFWIALIADASRAVTIPLFLAGLPGQFAIVADGFLERKRRRA